MSKALADLKRVFKNIESTLGEAVSRPHARDVAKFAISLIVKRTRLGYGVRESFGTKQKLRQLSTKYIRKRSLFADLDETTAPRKSNLTFTGQMLRSIGITEERITKGRTSIVIGPQGFREERPELTNKKVAEYNAANGRTFMNVSQLEYNQILRFYRKTFADLFRKRKLLR